MRLQDRIETILVEELVPTKQSTPESARAASRVVDAVGAAFQEAREKKEEPVGLKLRAGDGWSYTITDEDLLWMARAAEGEGDPEYVIWSWLQRYAGGETGEGNFRSYPSLTALVRAHSQPVNPKWYRDGEFCRPGGIHEHDDGCVESRLLKRDSLKNKPYEAIRANVRAAIDALRRNALPNPVPRSIDFADTAVATAYVSRNASRNGAQITYTGPAGGKFITTTVSRAWPEDWVTLQGGDACSWILIGDSQAVGLAHGGIEQLMSAKGFSLVFTTATIGISTVRTVSEAGAQIRAAVQRYAPVLAIIVLGGNDEPNAALGGHITALVQPLLAAGMTVVWVGPAHAVDPDIANRKAHVAAIQKLLLEGLGVTWLDGLPMTRDLTHTPDGVHFLVSGSARWAERIVAAIIPEPSLLWSLTPFGALLGNALKRC